MDASLKDIFGLISVLLVVGATLPYGLRTLRGEIKPHLFTWIIWTLTTLIAAAGRTAGDAGAGTWGQWISGLCCGAVALLALRQGEKNITRGDWLILCGALMAIPAWIITNNPLIAIIIVTCIDMAGYVPTFRKSWNAPHGEATFNYIISNIIHILSLAATTTYNLTTILFPAALFLANTALVTTLLIRRKILTLR